MTDNLQDLQPTQRFSSRAENYAKYRPSYPQDVVTLLTQEMGLSPASVIADVGCGTGILAELFLRNGNTVLGVEPNREMRQAAERLLAGWPAFRCVDGRAEATGLPAGSVDGIVVGQAFHWFDQGEAIREFRRITRPGGFVALIWNARRTKGSLFMAEYDRIVLKFGSDFARSGRDLVSYESLQALFGPTLRKQTFPNSQELDWEGLRGRILSASYMPLPGQPGHDQLMASLRDAFDRHQAAGRVRLEYGTNVYFGRL